VVGLLVVDSKCFWRWCITLWITGVLDSVIVAFLETRKQNVSGTLSVSIPRWGGNSPTLLAPTGPINEVISSWGAQQCGCLPHLKLRVISVPLSETLFSSLQNTGRWTKSKTPKILLILTFTRRPGFNARADNLEPVGADEVAMDWVSLWLP
jgi:hypothetical protein